ncbi:hypothetical protein [Enterococcus faecalis]|uniref:hypothetical protein n=1 Tax=Enterococcus faecalis TaxID=1351 RepID=UPI000353470E|nr:hypothetical protein [Enterococcus faecalis]EPH85029.1 hypothetical protein D924_01230 [Enterococcus faecalis 06-MB-S-10]EPH85380.1 hypothetical protein D927_00365 [Enterococcus faecalis 02-MB-BW-10]EPH92732.1 hypothetical protein D923_00006 [Enterococcus faecalis 06-MB-S-04]
MKIIDKKQLKTYIRHSLKSDCTIKIYTFKKDRYIAAMKNKDIYTIQENGFYQREFNFLIKKDAIKTMIKLAEIEFKNSHKLFVIAS